MSYKPVRDTPESQGHADALRFYEMRGRAWNKHPAAMRWMQLLINRTELTPIKSELARLRFVEGWKNAECAESIKRSPSYVAQLVLRVERQLYWAHLHENTKIFAPSEGVREYLTTLPDWMSVSLDAWEERGDAPWIRKQTTTTMWTREQDFSDCIGL
jgi:hypothetical protein